MNALTHRWSFPKEAPFIHIETEDEADRLFDESAMREALAVAEWRDYVDRHQGTAFAQSLIRQTTGWRDWVDATAFAFGAAFLIGTVSYATGKASGWW